MTILNEAKFRDLNTVFEVTFLLIEIWTLYVLFVFIQEYRGGWYLLGVLGCVGVVVRA